MICTMRPHLHTAASTSASTSAAQMVHTMPSHNDLILRAIEREREALLAKTHAAFSYHEHSPYADANNVTDVDDDEEEYDNANAPRYDVRGRQAEFRETVRQRQARLEFLRRQDAAKRRASRTRKVEETVMTSLSRSVFYPTTTYSPTISTSSDSSDSDSLAEPDSDSDDEWDAPAPRVRLYVVDEEDEEEDDYTFSATAIYSQYEHSKPQPQPQLRQIARSPSSPRSPVARVPSLESIPERPELEN